MSEPIATPDNTPADIAEVVEPDPTVTPDSVSDDNEPDDSDDDSDSEESESSSEREKKELLTREKVASLMDGDALEMVVVGIFDQIVANVETGKSAAKVNTDSYAAALKEYNEANTEESSVWLAENDRLTATLDAIKAKIAEHKSLLESRVEPFRKVSEVDLGSVNERHRKMKTSLFGFLTAAGVSDVESYRVPELPVAVRTTTGWSPRLGIITVDGVKITHTGDRPTLTDLNKTLGIKGEEGQGATWAKLFGTRDVPTSGLTINRTIQGKTVRIKIFPQSAV